MIVPANKPRDEFKFRLIATLLSLNLVLLSLVLFVHFSPFKFDAETAYFVVNVIPFALFIWLLTKLSAAARRRRAARYRNRLRSPWGERRTEEPRPYNDRLATFVSAASVAVDEEASNLNDALATDAQSTLGDPLFRSQMPFWSAVDVPCESEPPKPTWFIRRILRRIRESLMGYR